MGEQSTPLPPALPLPLLPFPPEGPLLPLQGAAAAVAPKDGPTGVLERSVGRGSGALSTGLPGQ